MASIAQFVKFRVESNKERRKFFQNKYVVRKTFLENMYIQFCTNLLDDCAILLYMVYTTS